MGVEGNFAGKVVDSPGLRPYISASDLEAVFIEPTGLRVTVADDVAMRLALEEADIAARENEVPVGAVVMYHGNVIARDHNRILQLSDPTAHAEMLVIRQATSSLGVRWLTGCAVFVTLEPCAMCAGALVLARVSRLVFGASDPKMGACGSLRNVVEDARLNHRMDVCRGVLKNECGQVLRGFFRHLRRQKEEGRR